MPIFNRDIAPSHSIVREIEFDTYILEGDKLQRPKLLAIYVYICIKYFGFLLTVFSVSCNKTGESIRLGTWFPNQGTNKGRDH